ncbi:MAG: element excision factor XisI family protein [Phormidium sp.]
MDKLNHYRSLIQKILQEYHKLGSGNSDVEQANLDEMLADYQKLMADLNEVRSKLKFELMEALGDDSKIGS